MKFCSFFILLWRCYRSRRRPGPNPQPPEPCAGRSSIPRGPWCRTRRLPFFSSGGPTHSATTNHNGSYEIANLPPGNYTVTANAKGFTVFVQNDVAVAGGQASQFNIALEIQVEQQKLNVEEEGPRVEVNPANNASAIVLKGAIWTPSRRSRRVAGGPSGSCRTFRRARWRPDCTLMDSLRANCHRNRRSARFASTESLFCGIRQTGIRTN